MRYLLIVMFIVVSGVGGYVYGEWKTEKKWHGFMERHLQAQFAAFMDNNTFLLPPGQWTIQRPKEEGK